MALKIIFMGTPEFAVPILETIYKSEHKILNVYTQTPKKSKRGQKINLSPIHNYSKFLSLNVRHPEDLSLDIEYIKRLKPDVVIVVAYGKLIPVNILNINGIEFINIHASLLPKWRGAAPIQRSIIAMDKETGITIMKIVQKLDTGPYMLQEKLKIEKNENFFSLSKRLSILGSKLIIKSLEMIEKKNFKWINQDDSKASYARKIDKKETEVDWNISARKLIARINGLSPVPGVWFTHNKNRLKIIKALEVEKKGKIGEVLNDNLTIACKENAIEILQIQKEGKKILNSKDFLSGYKIKKGEILF